MPTFQVRNRATKMVLGEVTVEDPADVLNGLKEATGSSIEEIAFSLGSTVEQAKAALDVAQVKISPNKRQQSKHTRRPTLAPRRLFA